MRSSWGSPWLRELRARNRGLEPDGLEQHHAAFIGLGSVGTAIALDLARAGVGRFTLIDPGTFSVQNVARHPGDLDDLGRLKRDLVRQKLRAHAPGLHVSTPELDVRDFDHDALLEALGAVDLLVVSIDDPTANLAANHLALELGTQAHFAGVSEGGIGGEIYLRRPGHRVCYACVAAFRARVPPLPRAARVNDHLNLRPGAELPPLNALAVDIGQHGVGNGPLADAERDRVPTAVTGGTGHVVQAAHLPAALRDVRGRPQTSPLLSWPCKCGNHALGRPVEAPCLPHRTARAWSASHRPARGGAPGGALRDQ